MDKIMNKQEFIKYAGTFGADLQRWPLEFREAARQFFNENPNIFTEEAALDKKLSALKATDAGSDLLENIMRKVAAENAEIPKVLFIFRHGWAKGAALISCAVLGIFLGSVDLPVDADAPESATSNSMDIDHVIFGSTTLNEVLP